MRLAAALCILFSSSLAGAQIKAGEDLPVQVDVALPLVQPHLAVHPSDPARLVAAAMVGHPDETYSALVFSSSDGGRTWRKHDPGSGTEIWAEFLADGTAVSTTGAEVFRSRDGGRTWGPPTVLQGARDHPMLAVDGNNLYLISSGNWKGPSGKSRDAVLAARSTDGGATFSEPGRAVVSNLATRRTIRR